MSTQPHNSMLPATVAGRFGEHRGMTRDDAIATAASAYDPADWRDVLNQSSAAYILGDDNRALDLAEDALRLSAAATPACINLSILQGSRGNFALAHAYASAAHERDPKDRTAATLYAETMLRLGRWSEAWPLFHNYYDSRRVSLFKLVLPEWEPGITLAGKRILVIEGGGAGDNFFFMRWLPWLKREGAHVTFLCPESMSTLALAQPYIDRVITTRDGLADELHPNQFDYFVPLLSLAGKFGATPESSGMEGPYIHVPAGADRPRRTRIGVCHRAGEPKLPRPFRTLSDSQTLAIHSAILDIGAEPISLVLGESRRISNWQDTAELIASCSLIVTVDTGVAHLAGALDIPTWTILPGFSAWYYLTESQSSPLYPSMRLFRNRGLGIENAVADCCKQLEELWKQPHPHAQ